MLSRLLGVTYISGLHLVAICFGPRTGTCMSIKIDLRGISLVLVEAWLQVVCRMA